MQKKLIIIALASLLVTKPSSADNRLFFTNLTLAGSSLTMYGSLVYAAACFGESLMLVPEEENYTERKKKLIKKYKRSILIAGGACEIVFLANFSRVIFYGGRNLWPSPVN